MLSVEPQRFAIKSIFATTKALYIIKNQIHFLKQCIKTKYEQTAQKNNSDINKIIEAYEAKISNYKKEIQVSWQRNKSMESQVLQLKQMMDQLLKGYENDIKAKNSEIQTLKNQLNNISYSCNPDIEHIQQIVQSKIQQTGTYLKLPLSVIQEMPESNTSTIRNKQNENQNQRQSQNQNQSFLKRQNISSISMEKSNCSYFRSQSTNISQIQLQKSLQANLLKKHHQRIYSEDIINNQNYSNLHFYSMNQNNAVNQQKKSISQLLDEEQNKENRQQNQNQLYLFMKPLSMNISKTHVRSCSSGSLHFQSISGQQQSIIGQIEEAQGFHKESIVQIKPRSPTEQKSVSICTQYEQQSLMKEDQLNEQEQIKDSKYNQIISYSKNNHSKTKFNRHKNIAFVRSQLSQTQPKPQHIEKNISLRDQLQRIISNSKGQIVKTSQFQRKKIQSNELQKQKINISCVRNNYFVQNAKKNVSDEERKKRYRSEQKGKAVDPNKNQKPRYLSSEKINRQKKADENLQKRKKIQTPNFAKVSQYPKNYTAASLFNAGHRKNKELLKKIKEGLSQYKLWKMSRTEQFTYEGNKIQGKRHGKGKIIYQDGTVYEGQFVNGLKHGNAKITKDGILIFSGTFKQDFIEGQCIIKCLKLFADKQCFTQDICPQLHRAAYVGGFSKHKMHGQGTIILNTEGDKIWTKINNGIPYGQLTFFQQQQVFFSGWP